MKIAIDARVLQFERSGIYRVTVGFIQAFRTEYTIHLLFSDTAMVEPAILNDPLIQCHVIRPKQSAFSLVWANVGLIGWLMREKPDVYYSPWNFGIPFRRVPGVRMIVTIHDLLPWFYPGSYPLHRRIRIRLETAIAVKRSETVITDSQFSAGLIKEKLGALQPVAIVPPYPHSCFDYKRHNSAETSRLKIKYGLPDNYVFYHGGVRPYKNIRKIMEVFDVLHDLMPEKILLCICGVLSALEKNELLKPLGTPGLRNRIIFPGFLPDDELAQLLMGATVFMNLSKMEGFGLAPLEAMACAVPVLCSRNSSHPEILGDAVLWVADDDTPQEIARQLCTFLCDQTLRKCCIEKGMVRASHFSQTRYRNDLKAVLESRTF